MRYPPIWKPIMTDAIDDGQYYYTIIYIFEPFNKLVNNCFITFWVFQTN